MKKKKKKKITPLESIVYKFGILIVILLVVAIVFEKTTVAQINLEVQYLRDEVNQKKDINTSLTMKINEMASLTNIEEVSEEEGLTYNSENIKTID